MTCALSLRRGANALNLFGWGRKTQWRLRWLAAVAIVSMPALSPVAAMADAADRAYQSGDSPAGVHETTEARLRRIEGELRALQRKVFPDGAGRSFAPEITPDQSPASPAVPSGNAAALGDVLSRMDAVESQIKALTETSEETQNRLGKLESRVTAVETAQAAPAPASQPAPGPALGNEPPADSQQPPLQKAAPQPDQRADRAGPGVDAPRTSTPVAANRAGAVAAIQRPSSDDKGEDAYTYGYRLWEAKFFPEAEAALLNFMQVYPGHKRISYARNLLGRAYLDDDKPGAAAQWFAQNYRADKAGDRAADSLLYLAVALIRLKEAKRACIALGEFHDTYPTEASGRLKGQYDAVTRTANCP